MAKTERVSITSGLDGETKATALASITQAIDSLDGEGDKQGRTLLWDTLELKVETSYSDQRTLMHFGANLVQTHTDITVSVLGVRS